MAGPTRAAGVPDYSSGSTSGFIPEIWAGKLVEKLYASTCFGEIANTDYEGVIRNQGDTVQIRTVPTITIRDYQIGGGLNYENPRNRTDRIVGGEGMEAQVDRGEPAPLVGQLERAGRQDRAAAVREPVTIDAAPERAGAWCCPGEAGLSG